MLALDDSRWNELQDAYGQATKVPALLQELSKKTGQLGATEEPWFSLWSALCHQGDIYTSSYAAVPHLIQIAHNAEGEIDKSFFLLPKEIVVARLRGKGPVPNEELAADLFGYLPHLLKVKLALHESNALPDDGKPSFTNDEGLCKQCGHIGDPHMIIALQEDRTKGGVIFCPEEGCTCFSTWGTNLS